MEPNPSVVGGALKNIVLPAAHLLAGQLFFRGTLDPSLVACVGSIALLAFAVAREDGVPPCICQRRRLLSRQLTSQPAGTVPVTQCRHTVLVNPASTVLNLTRVQVWHPVAHQPGQGVQAGALNTCVMQSKTLLVWHPVAHPGQGKQAPASNLHAVVEQIADSGARIQV